MGVPEAIVNERNDVCVGTDKMSSAGQLGIPSPSRPPLLTCLLIRLRLGLQDRLVSRVPSWDDADLDATEDARQPSEEREGKLASLHLVLALRIPMPPSGSATRAKASYFGRLFGAFFVRDAITP